MQNQTDPDKGEHPYLVRPYGGFSVTDSRGEQISLGRKEAALTTVLLFSHGHKRGRRWLETLLWTDRDQAQAANSLRQTLSLLRSKFGDAVGADRQSVWLNDGCFLLGDTDHNTGEELMAGFDVSEGFEDWRRQLTNRSEESTAFATGAMVERVSSSSDLVANMDIATNLTSFEIMNNLAMSLYRLAILESNFDHLERSIDILNQAINISNNNGAIEGIILSLNNLGTVYREYAQRTNDSEMMRKSVEAIERAMRLRMERDPLRP